MRKNHDISQIEWDLCRLYFDYKCAYCGKSHMEQIEQNNEDFHKEHVDDHGANDLSNCVPACTNCNSQKWKFPFGDWYNTENPVFDVDRKEKIMKWLDEDYLKYIEQSKT